MYDRRKVAIQLLVWDLRGPHTDIWPALDSCCVGGILASHPDCIIQVRLTSANSFIPLEGFSVVLMTENEVSEKTLPSPSAGCFN